MPDELHQPQFARRLVYFVRQNFQQAVKIVSRITGGFTNDRGLQSTLRRRLFPQARRSWKIASHIPARARRAQHQHQRAGTDWFALATNPGPGTSSGKELRHRGEK